MRFYALRVAAVLLIVCVSYTAMVYITSSPGKLFTDNFIEYDLPVSRGAATSTSIEQQYKLQNWQEVINTVTTEKSNTQKDLFLAGMSCLKIDQPSSAISFFKKIASVNQTTGNRSYQEESDFYSALTYLKSNDVANAEILLHTIQSNPAHAYYNDAKKISSFKLTLLKWRH